MDQKLMYAFRGWIGFVAFMDVGTAIRCFIENKNFFGPHFNSYNVQDDSTLSRILGYYSMLKVLTLVHCTLFIHYKPVVSLGICSLAIAIFMYLTEALHYHSTTLNFYIVFPCVLNGLTLIGLILFSKHLWKPQIVTGDENEELLRKALFIKRKRHKKDS